MITELTNAEGQKVVSTYFGFLPERTAWWLKANNIFDFQTQTAIADECFCEKGKEKMGKKDTCNICVGINAIEHHYETNRKLRAEIYRNMKLKEISYCDFLEYIRANNLFEFLKRSYCNEREITTIQ